MEEVLVDRPEVESKITRVTGPFCVEATIPTPVDWEGDGVEDSGVDPGAHASFLDRMLEVLRKSPVLQVGGGKTLDLRNIRPPAKTLSLSAEALVDVTAPGQSPTLREAVDEAQEKGGTKLALSGRPVALVFGPENGAVSEKLVYEAAREAHAKGYTHLYVIGFAIQPHARKLVEDCEAAVGVPATYVQATPDLMMGDLLKNMRSSQIFSVCGLPEVKLTKVKSKRKDEPVRYEVELVGFDVFDPATLEVDHRSGNDVPAWLLDTDYNGLCFHVCQAFFPRTAAWDDLKRALRTEYEETVWDHLAGTVSAPFEAGRAQAGRRQGDRRPGERTVGGEAHRGDRKVIQRVLIRRFKRFEKVEFAFPGHVVLAGPNNMGKTTLLQAIAAWDLAFRRWKELNNFQRRGGFYEKAPIARQAFSAVPLRRFDLLWSDRDTDTPIEIEIQHADGWRVNIEFMADSTEQIKVRPTNDATPEIVKRARLSSVFVPAMSGLSTEEPLYARQEFVDSMLSQARPGEVLRNLLVRASESEESWHALQVSIDRLFGYELLPPDAQGATIVCEYRMKKGGPTFDIASAGSGFQQILMLLTFLNTRPGSVLLLDEPDAHLHVILQDAIYGELRAVAAAKNSQLLIATHSEVIIDSVDPRELCVMLRAPRMLAGTDERRRLTDSLGILSNTDIMLAEDAPGVLYVEGFTDLEILRAWAKIVDHPSYALLTPNLFWRPSVFESRLGAAGISARNHYDALKLVRDDLPGLEILDRDARPELPATEVTGRGIQRVRWGRYEIESYLLHPDAIARFVEHTLGGGEGAAAHVADLRRHFEQEYPPTFLGDPLGDHAFLTGVKARADLLPRALTAAGLPAFPYTRYHEIAAVMKPAEIHPEVVEKLDAICKAFGQ